MFDKRSPRKISKDKKHFSARVIDRLGRDPRRLQLLFLSDADEFCDGR